MEAGWITGRNMDLFDHQWRSFRNSIPLMASFVVVYILLVNFATKLSKSVHYASHLILGVCFVYILHGYACVFILVLADMNFRISRAVAQYPTRGTAYVWIFNIIAMIAVPVYGDKLWVPEYLKVYKGLQNWTPMYHILVLKFISFGVDFNRAATSKKNWDMEKLDYKSRQETNRPVSEYSYKNYFTYILYAPLYVGGPMISFNAFQSQMQIPQTSYSFRDKVVYSMARFVAIFFLMEVFCELIHVNAINNGGNAVLGKVDSVVLALSLSVYQLLFMWLKFLLIWRFFRAWSIWCNIETIENMNRCLLNNYSMVQFWKDWHSSFNVWLVRYVYIPLGGSKSPGMKLLNTIIVFLFVAVWHDTEWRYIHWAWIVLAAIAPELVSRHVYYETKIGKKFRHNCPLIGKVLVTVGGGLNVLLMMSANLVGYVYGIEGLSILTQTVVHSSWLDMATIAWMLYSGVSTMYIIEQYRQQRNK
jgi:D-alanyl-lipoteichoic acid acyltransferase DltB (MBOAT superfamily)